MELELPDGTIAEFPEGTPPDVMKHAAMRYSMKLAADQGTNRAASAAQARGSEAEAQMARRAGGGPALPISAMATVPGEMGEQITPEHSSKMAGAGLTAASFMAGPALGAAAKAVPALAPVVAGAFGKPGQAALGAYEGFKHGGLTGAAIGAGAAVAGGAALSKVASRILPFLRGAVPAAEGVVEGAAVGSEAAAAKTVATELGVPRDVAKQVMAPVAPAVQAEAAQVTAAVAPKLGQQFTQEQIDLISRLRGVAQSSAGNKIQVAQAAQKVFPDTWKEVLKIINAPRTTMPTIYQP